MKNLNQNKADYEITLRQIKYLPGRQSFNKIPLNMRRQSFNGVLDL